MIRAALALLLVVHVACRPPRPAGDRAGGPPLTSIDTVLATHTDRLMALPGVVGVGQGERGGRPTVMVLVVQRSDSLDRAIPDSLDGFAVEIRETGVIEAQEE